MRLQIPVGVDESVYCTEDKLGKWGDLVMQGYAESIRE